MDTAKDLPISFHTVANYSAMAVRTNRRQRMDRTLKAIKGVMLFGNDHLKRLVVFISANLASSHT
jgi:hypothetical protein